MYVRMYVLLYHLQHHQQNLPTYLFTNQQIEFNAMNAALADKLVEWAGLRDRVRIIIGGSSETIPTLKEK